MPLVSNISASTKLRFNRAKIKSQKPSWSTCSSRGNINLNRNLGFLSKELVEYVIVHELCHTKIMNHSLDFWQAVEGYIPNWRLIRKKLGVKRKGTGASLGIGLIS